MMKEIFITGSHIISSLGKNSEENFQNILKNISGIKQHNDIHINDEIFYASLIDENIISEIEKTIIQAEKYTRLEKLIIYSISSLITEYDIELNEKTLIILSSTKGNISLLNDKNQKLKFTENRIYFSELNKQIEKYFKLKNKIITVSNACISGSLAISVARNMLQNDKYENAIVIGADEVSKFIFSGFNSFQAISFGICKPFDKNRTGISLGEATASVYLTKNKTENKKYNYIKIEGITSCNDANHISGPSRTGEGLYRSIQGALKEAEIKTIDFILAHGTATNYNDEMESIAFHRSDLLNIETNSLKGYYGHTLGASGILETILGIYSINNNLLVKSLGFEEQGTTHKINILKENKNKKCKTFLKTASGFGGSNIATIFSKIEN